MACVQKFRKCGLKPNWETNLYLSVSAFFLGSLFVNSNSIVFVALYMIISPPPVTGGGGGL